MHCNKNLTRSDAGVGTHVFDVGSRIRQFGSPIKINAAQYCG